MLEVLSEFAIIQDVTKLSRNEPDPSMRIVARGYAARAADLLKIVC
jgi:hypothetical protein